jgi:hypothetical protein
MTQMALYRNNGLSCVYVDESYTPTDGEVLFPDIVQPDVATTDQLKAAFPNYSAALLADQAKKDLADTDRTMLRISEAVALGSNSWTSSDVSAFVEYRRSLRAIQNGTDTQSTTLPSKPPFPAGT